MKRIVSLLLVSLMLLTAIAVTGCSGSGASLKLGLGVSTAVSAADATEDKAGQGQATITAAAVLVDADGKIVKAFIDVADNKVGYTADGKAERTLRDFRFFRRQVTKTGTAPNDTRTALRVQKPLLQARSCQ